jgi:hypothetical protein
MHIPPGGIPILRNDESFMRLGEAELYQLRQRFHGSIVTPLDVGYDSLRRVWNGLIDRRPALILLCAHSADVQCAVTFARDHRLIFSVRGGGHEVAANAIMDSAILIDLALMKQVFIDKTARTIRVQGGARWADVQRVADEQHLSVPAGIVSTIGVGGLTLGGGLGWLMRSHGLTVDNLIEAEIVTADGQIQQLSKNQNQELFWALCGAGANFGVVTSFTFKACNIGSKVWFGTTLYAQQHIGEGLRFLREFMPTAPKELTILTAIRSTPPPLRRAQTVHDQTVLAIMSCYCGTTQQAQRCTLPLREFAQPLFDQSTTMPFGEVQRQMDAEYPEGQFYYWKSLFIEELSDRIIETITTFGLERPSDQSSIVVWTLGGAITDSDAQKSSCAFAPRHARYLVAIESNWSQKSVTDKNIIWTRSAIRALKPFSTDSSYVNFAGFRGESNDLLENAFGPNLPRLKQLKTIYDPHGLIRGNMILG